MITTLYRPPALKCGGVNALQPLNRDCNVVEPGTCEPTAPLPIGIWFDGTSLLWDKGGRVAVFGEDILTDQTIQSDILEDWDSEMDAMLVDEDVWSANVSHMMGFETIPPGIAAGGDWEHYKFFSAPPRMFAAAAAMIYNTTTGQPYSFYTRHYEPVRLGLAVRVISGDLSKILGSEESAESGLDALILMPIPGHLLLEQLSDPITMKVLDLDTGAALGTVHATLTPLAKMYGLGVAVNPEEMAAFSSSVKFSIDISEINGDSAPGLNMFDRVFTKYLRGDEY